MDAIDEFLGKDGGESNCCLRDMLAHFIIFGAQLMTVILCRLILVLRFLFNGRVSKENFGLSSAS